MSPEEAVPLVEFFKKVNNSYWTAEEKRKSVEGLGLSRMFENKVAKKAQRSTVNPVLEGTYRALVVDLLMTKDLNS